MTDRKQIFVRKWLVRLLLVGLMAFCSSNAFAHPLGNFTVNHFTRIELDADHVSLRCVLDMAEIPTFQELQKIDTNGDGKASLVELNQYVDRNAPLWSQNLMLTVDGARVPLSIVATNASLPPGAGGLETLRIELDLAGQFSTFDAAERKLLFEDNNYSDRIGWREIVVTPINGVKVFNSTAFGNGLSSELRSYPEGMLAAPLDERKAQFSFTRGSLPAGARSLTARDGLPAKAQTRDRLAELIAVPQLTPGLALLGLLFAVVLGAAHALSPGHGKTVVGAYLVGTRGTARHAAFLGLTVTITHTAGVFALGVVTLFASTWIAPEKLFPVLSLISGALVVTIGLSLFVRRLRKALRPDQHSNEGHSHDHDHNSDHEHNEVDPGHTHSHGGREHSHMPPGTDGPVTWKSLLALGISGGILPCPSALVVLLAAISLHRVGYGLLLVVAFSVGLAGVLTGVGLVFVYAKRLFKSTGAMGKLSKVLPVASAIVITCAGLAICYEALSQAGISPFSAFAIILDRVRSASTSPSFASIGAFGILGLGLVYGLKHAMEADHIVAVSTIVSEHRKLSRAAVVGALWGVGHTASLVLVGTVVLALRLAVPEQVATWLEFAVALMIIGLGIIAFRKASKGHAGFHLHRHGHKHISHAHVHFHDADSNEVTDLSHSHAVARIGIKPTIVGAVHGLAGSAALTLLVLTQIGSPFLGVLYLAVFGVGSIVGMLVMSGLVGLPFVFSSRKLGGIHYRLQMMAGILSVAFGVWYVYETGIVGVLLKIG